MQLSSALRAIFRIGVLACMIPILRLAAVAAQPAGDPGCGPAEGLSAEIGAIIRITDGMAADVEDIPPDEATYIRREYELAMEQDNPARFDLVVSNRFYPALRFHEDHRMLHDRLDAAAQAQGQDMAQHLVDAVARFTDVAASMNRYVNADLDRAQPILTRDARRHMRSLFEEARERATAVLKCVIAGLGTGRGEQGQRVAPAQRRGAVTRQADPPATEQPRTVPEPPPAAVTEPPRAAVTIAEPPRAAVTVTEAPGAAAAEPPRRAMPARNATDEAHRALTKNVRRALDRQARRAGRAEQRSAARAERRADRAERRRTAVLERRQSERAAECRWLRREFLRSSRRLDRRARSWRPPGC